MRALVVSISILALLLLLLVGLVDGFLPSSPLRRSTTLATSFSFTAATPGRRALLVVRRTAAAGASGDEEADCPCSDLGTGTGLGQAGPLTERCDMGDVVVLLLPEADAEGRALALAVVDGKDEAALLCRKGDVKGSEWVRDPREEPLRAVKASAVLRVVAATAAVHCEAEECWRIEEGDLEGVMSGLRNPVTAS